MAHSLFIIFFRVFSYSLISFIFLWSFCKISIIVLKEGATFRFTWTIFRLKIVYGNLNRSKIVECNKLKQLLINNGYSNSLFDCVLKKYVQQKQTQSQETPNQTLDLFYRNQMTSSYKIDEKVLKNIIKQNIKCTNENESIKLNIYYKNRKVSN